MDTVGTLIDDQELFEQAIVSFQDSIDRNPLSTRAYYEQGLVYIKMGECEKAEPLIKKYIQLDNFPDEDAEKYLDNCQRSKSG